MASTIQLPWHKRTDAAYKASIPGLYFHESEAPVKLFGGAVGGSKTTTLATEIIYLSLKYDNNRGFAGERDFDDLRRGLYNEVLEWLPENQKLSDGRDLYQHHKSEHWIKFYNGSEIHFVELKDEPRNVNLGWAAIDQAERVPEVSYEWLTTRLRLESVPYRPLMLSANPEPGWLYRRIVKDAQPVHTGITRRDGEELVVFQNGTALFIPSFISDNEHLPIGYYDALYNTLSPTRVERLLHGVWETVENAIYDQLERKKHLIPMPKGAVPLMSKGGADYGTVHLSAHATVTKMLDGTYWVREVWAEKTGDLERIKEAARVQHVKYEYQGGRADPNQGVLAQTLGYAVAVGKAGSRQARIGMVTRLLNANALFFDENGPGVRDAFEEALGYRYERRETETVEEDVVVRKGDDRIAAIEYAIEEFELGNEYVQVPTWQEPLYAPQPKQVLAGKGNSHHGGRA